MNHWKLKEKTFLFGIVLLFLFFRFSFVFAKGEIMPAGTLLYKSAPKGNVYGKNIDVIFKINKLFPPDFELNSGHTGIYIGNIHGVDMVVEAVPGGVTMDPLKYFVNLENGEKFLGAKIPKNTSKSQRKAAAAIARALAKLHLKYDYSFRHQKGPNSGQWTCVGLTEKAYESADVESFPQEGSWIRNKIWQIY